jgi:7,8-dihydro-6-hydroxymethylpterin-pyrophosphokinase
VFVLVPLADIAPEAVHPASGKTIRALCACAPPDPTLRRVAEAIPRSA